MLLVPNSSQLQTVADERTSLAYATECWYFQFLLIQESFNTLNWPMALILTHLTFTVLPIPSRAL